MFEEYIRDDNQDLHPGHRLIRIACISDTHDLLHQVPVPPCDLILHGGDITLRGTYPKLLEFDDWGASILLPVEQKICIAGNHDMEFQKDPETARAHISNWTYLEDSYIEVLGLKIYGTPWSPNFFPEHWVFNQDRHLEAVHRWSKIPDDTDILIVHGPPFGFGDWTPRGDVGCFELTERIKEIKPRLVVCGHIHEARGIYQAEWGTLVVNASVCSIRNQRYVVTNPPIMVNLAVSETVKDKSDG